jgi:hypothetical protein
MEEGLYVFYSDLSQKHLAERAMSKIWVSAYDRE